MFRFSRIASIVLCIALASLATSVVHAEDGRAARMREAANERLQAADGNQDGYIDRSEADAGLPRVARRFDDIDADGDGRLSRGELDAAVEQMRQARGR